MENEAKFEVSVGAGDIVHMVLGGNINVKTMSEFHEWAGKVKETVKEVFDKTNKKILCIADISELNTYHPDVLMTLAQLMKDNEPYVLRTATFGGSQKIIMAEDVVIALSGRGNIKAFKEKQKAMDWLQERSN